ncbi:ABC transporter substrate-binding protein [Lactobacillus selangorensis]|uniref:ABC transporter substrate-binding protein n=1 Tax=Lactobacillus selangorensis TaxID=81857 RepID=A0A0R2FH21_9LACO|nr:zinc ABC transporter substrate-binding protein [Lactobacillus selangorensis]KRN27550.1 ABC transporter substrate-binding protein [Lactobacillus selangorensis]KRN30177.1 ABC transporter substrate-binding protein [Lactobacillus selangorensis]
MKKKRIWGGLLVLILLTAVLLQGCQARSTKQTVSANGKIQIVSSLDFYGQVAKQVAGRYGHVTSIINNPAIDPHDYNPTTDNAKAVSKAQVVLYNGLGYDDWMPRLINATNSPKWTLAIGTQLLHKKDGANEHVWYEPTTMIKLTKWLVKTDSKIDPAHKSTFEQNGQAYLQTLKPLQQQIQRLKQHSHHQKVAVSEPVFNYSLSAMGYRISNEHFAKAIENGTDPSPADIAAMQKDIKQHKIAFFVENTQTDDTVIRNMVKLCKQYKVPVVKVTETLPAHMTYQEWMTKQYDQVEKIQNKE